MATPLSFRFAQTVAVGPFNPFIVTPEWSAKHVLDAAGGEDVEWPFEPAISPYSRFTLGNFDWDVSFEQLAVGSGQPVGDADCGRLVAKVLELLPHTPVRAVGNNFIFDCPPETWGARPLPSLGPTPPAREMPRSRWVGQFPANGANVEFDVNYVLNSVVVVQLNFDRRVKDAKEGMVAAGKFAEDHAVAQELIRELLQSEVP